MSKFGGRDINQHTTLQLSVPTLAQLARPRLAKRFIALHPAGVCRGIINLSFFDIKPGRHAFEHDVFCFVTMEGFTFNN